MRFLLKTAKIQFFGKNRRITINDYGLQLIVNCKSKFEN